MMFLRPWRLLAAAVCILAASTAGAQQTSAQQPPAKQNEQKPAQPQNSQNPFETVPEEKEQPAPAPAAPAPARGVQPPPAPTAQPGGVPDVIETIEFRGTRRVPQDTLRALIFSKPGDKLDEDVLHRDFMTLWNTGRLDDLRLEREPGKNGWIIRFMIQERPVVRSITYEGNKSVSVSDILDRYKERKVGLSVESQYDQSKVQRARNVLQELLSERGHQYASVTPELHPVPPSSLNIVFRIDEGPTVKVGKIGIEGNSVYNDRTVIRAMKNLKPIGIPYSILFENIFARTFDPAKLEEDQDRIRVFYQEHGYFKARAENAKVNIRDVPPSSFRVPFMRRGKAGKRADLTVSVNEGHKYTLGKFTFSGVKLFRTPQTLMRPLFQMSEGDVFSTAKLRKGVENMRKLYGEFGYIDFVVEPDPEPVPGSDRVDLNLSVDEGKQFFVRRIDFTGNNTTRDKVIRRELLIDEGDLFNSRLWDLSVLRLNQLGYFEPLKEEQAADLKRDTKTDTIDITLKVKERGKNSIQLNGGVSGIAGSFIGFSYATNNFLGLGETLSLSSQLGTRMRQVQFGFTEPYLFDKPIQSGFTVYTTRFNYNQGVEASILSGQNLTPLYNALGSNNLLNYVSNGYGFTTFMSTALKRSFARVGLAYGYDISNIKTLTDAATTYFDYLDFQGVGGPNSLSGIRTSKITPSYSYNTVNHPIEPTAGRSLYASVGFAGLGGNVNTLEPQIDMKYFHKGFRNGHVIGLHLQARVLTGYGGKVAPPFSRYYIGGENDVRGFDIWGISPVAFIPDEQSVNIYNANGTQRVERIVNSDGSISFNPVTKMIPTYRLVLPGGDTVGIGNFEYRIKIFGPVALAPFFDAGLDKLAFSKQLKLNPGRLDQLNSDFPQAGYGPQAYIAPGTQKLRMSTGLELQVLMPVVNAPFRVYWSYNPSRVNTTLQPPLAVDRSMFPNDITYYNAIALYGTAIPYKERSSVFRFTIGRTF
ncbi:MAG: outer membrane protein assembly factor BamA [Bryobacteraceae bacterium]|jgi:outer membrane protein insertion porin family